MAVTDSPGEEPRGYLVDYDLASAYRSDTGVKAQGALMAGPVADTVVSDILESQEKVEPRPLMPGVKSEIELDDWVIALPAVSALRRYLDGHVPDGEQDLIFTEDTMPDLVHYMMMGIRDAQTIGDYFDILEDHGFIPDESMLSRVLELLSNAANAVPLWPNNGWSANELLSRQTGGSVFFDEDGRPMKVGRNDPCPCGSGKKFKNCHGKRR